MTGKASLRAPTCSDQRLLAQPLPTTWLQDEPLDAAGTAAAFEALTAEVNGAEVTAASSSGVGGVKSVDEVAMGFIRVANEAMCRPIRCVGARGGCLSGEGRGVSHSHPLAPIWADPMSQADALLL